MTDDSKFPFEEVDLPSKGKFYPADSPLRSGRISVRYMTAQSEDILTSSNLISKGVVLDKLFESLIVNPSIKPGQLLLGDLNALMVATRILGYGKDYTIKTTCASCETEQSVDVDLTNLPDKESATLAETDGIFSVELPLSKAKVTFRLLTRKDELDIQAEIAGYKKINKDVAPESTTFLKYIITSANGLTKKEEITGFVNSMLVRDARFLRETYRDVAPDIKFEFNFTCDSCGKSEMKRLPIGVNFFWPSVDL